MVKYATGCAFSLDDMFMNFPYKKLKTDCALCKKVINNNHRQILVKRVFSKSLELVLEDIVNDNITFWFPLTGVKKCNMHMKRVRGKDFQNLRKHKKWQDVDFIKSFFCGYQIALFMLGNRTPRVKNVYLNRRLRDIITAKTNEGYQYGDSNKDRYIKDYYERVQSFFEGIPISDIKIILSFAWKSLYLHNSYGGDTLVTSNSFWCYIGNLKKNSLKHFVYYIRKLIVRFRVLSKRKKIPWDGYYYFALTDKQYEQYLQQNSKRGRFKKYFTFHDVMLYSILDECRLSEYNNKYIFRLGTGVFNKCKYYIKELRTDKAEVFEIRKPLKFEDILISNHEYELL